MGELNIGSERIITVIQCNVKSDPEEFKKWIKDRASKYVYELKEENTISYEWGETLIESVAGTVEISADGLTFTNTGVNGSTSTATAGPNGWVVVIDGVEYEYSY